MSMIGVSDGIALVAVVMIGLPHGAFDGAVYQLWQGQPRLSGYVRFIISYLALAGVIIGLWLVFPVLSLFGFCLSAYHFGVGDSNAAKSTIKAVQIICHGGLATIWLMTTHQTDAARILRCYQGRERRSYGISCRWVFLSGVARHWSMAHQLGKTAQCVAGLVNLSGLLW